MQAGIARSGRKLLAALTAAAMVMSSMLVLAEPASAAHDPHEDEVANNGPAGTNETPYWLTYLQTERAMTGATCTKINAEGTTAYVLGSPPTGHEWVLLVVKQGETNFVFYDPVANHAYPSAGPNAPGHSHIIVCSRALPPGEIIVEKVVESGDTSQVFTFVTDGFTLGDNTLADGESSSSGDLAAGTYGVSETVPAGWTLVSATCDDGSDPDAIGLAAGETVTCTFTNSELPPPPGEIIVIKEVTPGSNTAQAFQFTAGYDGDGFALADGEQDDSGDLAPGTYQVSETVPAGWTLVSSTCDDGSEPDSIDLDPGETVICTFVNDEDDVVVESGEIIVQKIVVIGDASQEFAFVTDGFALADDTLGHLESSSSGPLDAGDYGVSETVPAGWDLLSSSCSDGSDPSSIGLDAGEVVICTFRNVGPEVAASILFTIDGACHEIDEAGVIDVTISVAGGAEVVVTDSANEVVGTFTADGSLTVPDNDTYSWVATPNPGFVFPPGTQTSGSLTIGDCADQVLASIVVSVTGRCDLVGDDGRGRVTVTMSVAGGADVVVRDSDGDVVGTLSADGTINVPEGEVYTWVATPNPGFEFPAGFDNTGSVRVEPCSNPAVLPFTGLHTDELMALGIVMLMVGGLTLLTSRTRRRAH